LLDEDPDMVISGINHGANLGDDVLYSGTVAAAVEGRFLGLPAIAVSLVGDNPTHFDTAAQATRDLVLQLIERPLPADTILNVNVPDIPYNKLEGFESTRLGNRHRAEPVVPMRDPKGRDVYWVGPAGIGQEAGPGTDFYAIEHNRISVTPLQVDLTRHDHIAELAAWLPTRLSD
jgi:5'-nucleotidase